MNLHAKLTALQDADRYRQFRHTPTDLLNLSGNDYLGLACDRHLAQAFVHQYQVDPDFDFGASSSRLLTGNRLAHERLEDLLSRHYHRPALIFNSGYHMNVGILPAICDDRTLILADKWVHASLIDGMRLAAAKSYRYRHQDFEQLRMLISKHYDHFDQIIIVTESVFSMDGDVTDLTALVEIKHQFAKVMLYVDEAHAVGVFGAQGLGVAEHLGVMADIDFLAGTFGKAYASVGGFVICSQLSKAYLINTMRPLIFSTNLPPVNALWSAYVFEQALTLTDKRQLLQDNFCYLIDQIKSLGFECPSHSQIIPIIAGDDGHAVQLAQQLQAQGFYVLPIRPPTVPAGTARVRVCLNADISRQTIDAFVQALGRMSC